MRNVRYIIRLVFMLITLFSTMLIAETYQSGDIAPRGAPDGQLNAADVLLLQQIVIGDIVADELETFVGDVAPFGAPDGELNAGDLLIQNRAVLGDISLGTISNEFPAFTSVPTLTTEVDALYSYQAIATDLDGDNVTYSLTQAPVGMVDDGFGLIGWTPTVVSALNPVTIQASDGKGGITTQVFNIAVTSPNQPPVITSVPTTNASIDSPYTYQVIANDPDGNPLAYTLASAPLGLNISNTGLITRAQTVDSINPYPVSLSDGLGGEEGENFPITVLGEPQAPPTLNLFSDKVAFIGSL